MSRSVWMVQRGDCSEYLVSILRFMLPEFERIFGLEMMRNEECIIFNDPHASCPMLITNSVPIKIRLAQSSLSFWAQTIFQLSHELCHYAIRQSKPDKAFTLSWFEEIVCEAMSLYVLQWASEHWESCELYSINPSFRKNIYDYLQRELEQKGSDVFKNCTSVDLLKKYVADTERKSHRNERNCLYYQIAKNPLSSRCFCNYPKYVDSNKITINYTEWQKNDANPMIWFLQSIQPCQSEIS